MIKFKIQKNTKLQKSKNSNSPSMLSKERPYSNLDKNIFQHYNLIPI
jgi:hypothetical protein